MLDVKLQDVKQTDKISGHEIAGHENAKHENVLAFGIYYMTSTKSRHSYCSYRIIQTISEQSLQCLVRTESYERFSFLP